MEWKFAAMYDVLLIRAMENSQNTISFLKKNGISIFHEPFHKIDFISIDCQKLQNSIKNSDYLIITSINAVKNLKLNGKKIFCVGENLMAFLLKKGASVVLCEKNAINLKKKIQEHKYIDRFLYLRGEKIAVNFDFLENFEEIIVYKVCFSEHFSDKLRDLIEKKFIKSVILFSRETALNFCDAIVKNNLEKEIENLIFFGISEKILSIVDFNVKKIEIKHMKDIHKYLNIK